MSHEAVEGISEHREVKGLCEAGLRARWSGCGFDPALEVADKASPQGHGSGGSDGGTGCGGEEEAGAQMRWAEEAPSSPGFTFPGGRDIDSSDLGAKG